MRDEWNMFFACGEKEALRILEQSAIDIVISDMRMPGMDGAQLLREVQHRYPHHSVILSNNLSKEMVLQSIVASHLFLSKPCETKVLRGTIQRACPARGIEERQSSSGSGTNADHTEGTCRSSILRSKSLVESDNWSLKAVSDIVAKDPGMTAKVLQLVNSAYFGLATNVSTVEEAVNFLGVDIVQSLMLTADVFTQFPVDQVSVFHIDRLWSKV
ncbi:MAG: response regulator [Nitrospira sp.]|nr:response regulator [Nitrospira sp.]